MLCCKTARHSKMAKIGIYLASPAYRVLSFCNKAVWDTWLRAMSGQNRRSVIAWQAWLHYGADAATALADFRQLQPPLACPHLHFVAARRLREQNQPEDALLLLLHSASTEIGDPAYHAELLRCAMALVALT
jgi:hypothetical protein